MQSTTFPGHAPARIAESGLQSVQRDSIFLLRSMGAKPLKSFRYFHLPHALPHIFASLKVAITFAVVRRGRG
jgi:NitT/TauT family transport system permease protein